MTLVVVGVAVALLAVLRLRGGRRAGRQAAERRGFRGEVLLGLLVIAAAGAFLIGEAVLRG